MELKEAILSTRLTKHHRALLEIIASEQGIKTSALMENITTNFLDVFYKCFDKRHDVIIQRVEIKSLYNRFDKKQLDGWVDEKYPKTESCMRLFSPIMNFNEMSETWMGWFKLNNHHLFYEDLNDIRKWKCDGDMGYNWYYVHGKIYERMFELIKCKVSDLKVEQDGFEFKVIIPKTLENNQSTQID